MKTHLCLILALAFATGCNRTSSVPDRSENETTVAHSGIGQTSINPAYVPNATDASKDNLSVIVKTIDRNIQMQNSINRNADLRNRARIEFEIRNNQETTIRDVDIKLLVQPGLKLTEFNFGNTNLMLKDRNEDYTEFSLKRLLEFQPGQKLCFSATVEGVESGIRDFEVQVSSLDIPESVAGRDSVHVSN